jgi:signal transduction histidine kinase
MGFHKQVFVGCAALVALITAMAATGPFALRLTSADDDDLAQEYEDNLAPAERFRFLAERLVATNRGYLLTGEPVANARFADVKHALETGLLELRNAALEIELAMAQHRRDSFERKLQSRQRFVRRAEVVVVLASSLAVGCGLALALLLGRRLARRFREAEVTIEAATRTVAAREEALAVISHDLRNPLHAITMGARAVQETTSEGSTRRYIHAIGNAAERMKHMVDRLLEAWRIECGLVDLRCEKTSTREIIDTTVEMFQVSADERHVRLTGDAPACFVVADSERVVEVLSNLIGNALEFAPRDGHVAIGAEVVGDAVRFTVTDDGPGIAPEQIPHLFERYWRGDTRERRHGLGLGLYICKQLVQAHHGTIGVDSTLGAGATFWFTLPVRARPTVHAPS